MVAGESALLFDARRGIAYARPRWRGVSHEIWFFLSLGAGVALVTRAGRPAAALPLAVYAGSVSALFGASALYHRVDWRPDRRRVMQRVDHAMIFILIAGTYTPVLALGIRAPSGPAALVVVWVLALAGLAVHMCWLDAPEMLVGGTYIGLGVLAIPVLPALWRDGGPPAFLLLVAGGVLYVIGALAYHHRRPDPAPQVFGYHEVFHAFVCAAATCHYIAVAVFLG